MAFISADFINDDQTYIRTQKVIERYNNDETVMLPILVRNCMWKSTPFVNLPLLPKNTQPLNNKQYWNSEDDALTSVVNDIYESINEFSYEDVVEEPAETDISELAPESVTEEAISEITPEVEATKAIVEDAIEEIEPQVEVDGGGGLVEQLEEISEPEPVEEAPVVPEVKKTKPKPAKAKVKIQGKSNVDLQVDWRKKYYRRVFWKRAAAFILDQILTFAPIYFLWIVYEVITMSSDIMYEPTTTSFVIFVVAYIATCAAFESSKWKATFGKRIMKLEITERNGDRIGFFKAFGRNILRLIVGYLLIILFPIQIYTYRKYKKLFHDQISYTVVGERLKK